MASFQHIEQLADKVVPCFHEMMSPASKAYAAIGILSTFFQRESFWIDEVGVITIVLFNYCLAIERPIQGKNLL